jgi:O-Antigen ligase
MIGMLLLGFGLLAVVGLGVVLLEALSRRAELGAALVLGLMVLQAVLIDRVPALTLSGASIRVLPFDVVFTLLLAAAVARLLRMRRFSALQRCVVLLGVLLLLAVVRGMMAFGVEHSVAEFRLLFAFACGALYFATFPPSTSRNDRIGRIWLAASIPMMVLVCLRWLATFAGIDLGVPAEKFGVNAAIRVIDGPYTFFLAHAAVLTVPFWQLRDERARRLTRLGVVLLLFVVVLNRRTVWLALLVGVAVVMLRNRRLGRRAVVTFAGAAAVTAAVYLALPGLGKESGPVAQSATGTGTLDWRIEGWQGLLESWSKDPVSWLIGQPFGSGFARRVEGMEVVLEAHNFYLTTLLRTGTVGLVALIVLTGGLLRVLWRAPVGGSGGLLGVDVFPALLGMQLVWLITWTPGIEQGIVTGLAVALATARVSSRQAQNARRAVPR